MTWLRPRDDLTDDDMSHLLRNFALPARLRGAR